MSSFNKNSITGARINYKGESQKIKLPSIGELTSNSSISYGSQVSPRIANDGNIKSILGNDINQFKCPVRPSPPANYVLRNSGTDLAVPNTTGLSSVINNAPGHIRAMSSPINPYYEFPPQSQFQPQPQSQPVNYQYYQPQSVPPIRSPNQLGFSSPTSYHQPSLQHNFTIVAHIPPDKYVMPEVINHESNKCQRCGTTETPEWRRGPSGVRTLCNACGLFHAKLVKRKGAALAAEEVLRNKVCKGKNGRRISIKKHILNPTYLKHERLRTSVLSRSENSNSIPGLTSTHYSTTPNFNHH